MTAQELFKKAYDRSLTYSQKYGDPFLNSVFSDFYEAYHQLKKEHAEKEKMINALEKQRKNYRKYIDDFRAENKKLKAQMKGLIDTRKKEKE
jgi:peptidoglycan hydrolase CwlO-like protein